MRLRRLELRAFGSFDGVELDFAAGEAGLHVIYGDNEAGKSTTLRALEAVLFGFPHETRDAYRHAPKDLRVGVELEMRDGQRLHCVRRKGRKNTLLDAEDRPLADSALGAFLHGIGRERFRVMFGLDQIRLRSGAQALLAEDGDVGASLFDAGIGGCGVHRVLEQLDAAADEIFRPNAPSRELNLALQNLKDSKRKQREAVVSEKVWSEQQQEIERLSAAIAELDERLRRLREEQSRTQRIVRVAPILAEREAARVHRAELGDVPDLGVDAASRRLNVIRDKDEITRRQDDLVQRLAALERKRDAIAVPADLLAMPVSVRTDLDERLAALRAARATLPQRRANLRHHQESARRVLTRLGRDASQAAEVAPGIGAPIELATLQRALRAAQATLGDSAQLLDLRTRLAGATELAAQRAAALGRIAGTLDEVSALPVPDAQDVEQFAARARAAREHENALAARRDAAAAQARDAAHDRDALDASGRVPTEVELEAARRERDGQWTSLRERGAIADDAADRFELATGGADDLADRLRREADRVAQRAGLDAAERSAAAELGRIDGESAALQHDAEVWAREWRELWRPAGIDPAEPDAMRRWLDKHRELVRDVAGIVELRAREGLLATQVGEQRELLAAALAAAGGAADAGATLASLVETANDFVAIVAELDRARAAAAEESDAIESIERDSALLAELVAHLTQAHAPDLGAEDHGRDAVERGSELIDRHRRAVDQGQQRADLIAQCEEVQEQLVAAKHELATADERLAELLRVAGVANPEELEQRERIAQQAQELEKTVRDRESDAIRAGDGLTLDELEARVGEISIDEARSRLAEVKDEIATADEDRMSAVQERANTLAGLRMFESRSSAELASATEGAIARVREVARRYVRAKLAAELLRGEVETYREVNQDPIVHRASELFPILTLGNNSGLCTSYSDADRLILQCRLAPVDQLEELVDIDALSDGALDQLYLALRIASLERYAQQDEPLPFVVDDMLIHFDDDRARAAIEVLAELSATTQVLFFTHHRRLLEIAKQAVPAAVLGVHDLSELRAQRSKAVKAAAANVEAES